MVEIHNHIEGKAIARQKLRALNSVHCRVLLRLVPNFDEDFPRFSLPYLSKVLNINYAYLEEILDFLLDKDVVSYEDEKYFLTTDNIWRIQEVIDIQPAVILRKKLHDLVDR